MVVCRFDQGKAPGEADLPELLAAGIGFDWNDCNPAPVWTNIQRAYRPRMFAVSIEKDPLLDRRPSRFARSADAVFLEIETTAYISLGVLLAVAVVLGVVGAALLLYRSVNADGQNDVLVVAIDRLLFVLMVVEILHTVRVSFRSGTLVCEPFLIVGLIASIRRVLVITLESSQVNEPGRWTANSQALLHATMLELLVLAVLILVMVTSIYLLRRSKRQPVPRPAATEEQVPPTM